MPDVGRCVIAVDLGSSAMKAVRVDTAGVVTSHATAPLDTTLHDDGSATQDPARWWDALGSCVRELTSTLNDPRRVDSIAITSQFMSTVAVDANQRPVGPAMMWLDGLHHHQRIGRVPGDTMIVEPADAIAAMLSGALAANDNTSWGMWRVPDHQRAKLRPLGEVRGALTAVAAEHLGLTTATVVTDTTLDTVTSAVGTGATGGGLHGVTIGTTAVIGAHVPHPVTNSPAKLGSMPSPLSGQHAIIAECGVAGKVLEIAASWLADGSVASLFELANGSVPGARGVVFMPWLNGSMAPRFDSLPRGGFVNVGLRADRADMCRAVVEGVCSMVGWLYPHVVDATGAVAPHVKFAGGAARSDVCGQVLADTLGVPVSRLSAPTFANAHGAALLALSQRGFASLASLTPTIATVADHQPDPSAHEVLRARLSTLTELHDRVPPILHTPTR